MWRSRLGWRRARRLENRAGRDRSHDNWRQGERHVATLIDATKRRRTCYRRTAGHRRLASQEARAAQRQAAGAAVSAAKVGPSFAAEALEFVAANAVENAPCRTAATARTAPTTRATPKPRGTSFVSSEEEAEAAQLGQQQLEAAAPRLGDEICKELGRRSCDTLCAYIYI